MKALLCLATIVTFAVVANAEIQFFFTPGDGPWGLTANPAMDPPVYADPFEPSSGTGADWYYGYYLKNNGSNTAAPAVPADVPPYVNINWGEFAYLWVHFDSHEVLNDKITRIEGLGFKCVGYYDLVQFTSYACDNGSPRWDSYAYPYAELKQNPQTLVSTTSPGIVYKNANDWPNLYVGGGVPRRPQYHTVLLGAVRPPSWWQPEFGPIENLCTGVWTYPTGERSWSFLNSIVPEPASPMLLGLATLALRRR